MIVTALWEDHPGVKPRQFGPHVLLLACIADRTGRFARDLESVINPIPKKGRDEIIRSLDKDYSKLKRYGPVFAIFDRDKIRDHWKKQPPPDCMKGIIKELQNDAEGNYEVIFLDKNVESLIAACCKAMEKPAPAKKAKPNERDRILAQAAWSDRRTRDAVIDACPSFGRLVEKVCGALPPSA